MVQKEKMCCLMNTSLLKDTMEGVANRLVTFQQGNVPLAVYDNDTEHRYT